MSAADLRPLSLGEILDRSFSLYRRHFLMFIGITGVPLVILYSVTRLLELASGTSFIEASNIGANTGFAAGAVFFAIVLGVGSLLVYTLAQGATVSAVSEVYLGRTTGIGPSYRRVGGKLPRIIGATILQVLAIGCGMILLIVPGVILLLRTAVTLPVIVFEDLGPAAAISRSIKLTQGSGGRIFVVFLLTFVLSWGMSALVLIPFMVASLGGSGTVPPWAIMGRDVGNLVAQTLITPFTNIAITLLYYDLRVRKEAFDLQLMMGALDGTAAPVQTVPVSGPAPSPPFS